MSAAPAPTPTAGGGGGLSTGKKVGIAALVYLLITIALVLIFGNDGKNETFEPQSEFKLEPWIEIKLGGLDLSINRAVFYLFMAVGLTTGLMVWIARRMQAKPNRVQTAMELSYDLVANQIVKENLNSKMSGRWFAFIATLFFFIWISNIIGMIPLPTNTEHKINILGADVPSIGIYAATANITIPIVLTVMVYLIYHFEGLRKFGPVKYMKKFVPEGITGPAVIPLFAIELISDFVRLISLSVRLFANILAGHLLILFMAGGLAVLLGIAALGWITTPMAVAFFLFEIGIVVTLQAFIFAILTAIYLGGATSEGH